MVRECTLCHKVKDPEEFPPDKRNRNGRSSLCRACAYTLTRRWQLAHPEAVKAANARRYERHHDRIRAEQIESRLVSRYGITELDYQRMLAEQGRVCAICGSADPKGRSDRLHVDHCHETGIVRGLLCGPCNVRLGVLEQVEWCRLAEAYLSVRST